MATIRLRAAVAAALALGFLAGEAAAHPHVWVVGRTEIVFGQGGEVAALEHRWTFDELFSTMATQGLDTDGDGTLTREELAPLAEINVTSLSEFSFFTFLARGEEEAAFTEPEDYWLDFADGQLTLNFTLPVKSLPAGTGAMELSVYDPTYFVAFAFASDTPVTAANAPAGCAVAVTGQGDGPDIASAAPGILQSKPDFIPSPEFAATFAQTASIRCK